MKARPRLLFLITEDWYFWSHRLDLARAAQNSGFEVLIATRVQEHGDRITCEGFTLLPVRLLRRGRNPVRELMTILELIRLYRTHRPDIVHHVAMKPVLYGSLAARVAGVPAVVNAFAGLGYAFTGEGVKVRILRRVLERALRITLSLSRSVVLLQNEEDRERLIRAGVVKGDRSLLIQGSGVDINCFSPRPEAPGVPVVLLASRMLWDKGIGEFIQAVRVLQRNNISARFVLVGRCDEDNPACIFPEQLRSWQDEGLVEWWGHRDDMATVLASAAVVVLASYREGLPKILLEAASCGKAIVATDVPGSRAIVHHRVNGLLVPPRNATALAAAIEILLGDAEMRRNLGQRGREIVVKEFSVDAIAQKMLAVYRELLQASQSASCPQGHA